MNEIEQQILDYFKAQYPLDSDDITLKSRFKEDLDLDSIDMVDMREQVRIQFGVWIDLRYIDSIKRIEDLTSYILNNKQS